MILAPWNCYVEIIQGFKIANDQNDGAFLNVLNASPKFVFTSKTISAENAVPMSQTSQISQFSCFAISEGPQKYGDKRIGITLWNILHNLFETFSDIELCIEWIVVEVV